MKLTKITTAIVISCALVGCFEVNRNTDQLCSNNPSLQCQRLNMGDGQCRVPRTDLVWHRYEGIKEPSIKNKIEEYEALTEYRNCLDLASQIRVISDDKLKRLRFEALNNTAEDLKLIVKTLEKSDSPQALYFLWSQIGDEKAGKRFLSLEGTSALDTAEMQHALATYYTNRDPEKTRQLLIRTLELSNKSNLDPEVYTSLASIAYKMGLRKEAYVWTMAAEMADIPIASEKEIQRLYGFQESLYDELDDYADDIESAIMKGRFKESMLPDESP